MADPSNAELSNLEGRLTELQSRLADLKQLAAIEQLPPEQWAQAMEQMGDLEVRLRAYLSELNPLPALFWQVVRIGGVGLLLGILLRGWLGC